MTDPKLPTAIETHEPEKKDSGDKAKIASPANKQGRNTLALIEAHCPSIVEAIRGKDALLKETAEATLSWIALGVPGGDLSYAIRAIDAMAVPPIKPLEDAEERFLELKRIILKARGDADLNALAEEKLRQYAGNISATVSDANANPKFREAAETALSMALIGKRGADYPFIKKYIADHIVGSEEHIVTALREAELNFIDTRGLISSIIEDFKNEDEKNVSEVVKSIQLGISRFNILFVLLLIVGLGWSAMNLRQEALALVSASIGAAIAHLLAERNSVLAQKQNIAEAKDD